VIVSARSAIAAVQATLVHGEALPAAFRFSTDTRTLEPGDVFVALRGERFDGNDYVANAFAAGAAAAVVDRRAVLPPGAAALVVADTRAAYLAFAAVARSRSRARVVAVTGSAGKTTTTAFLAQILARAAAGRVVATPRNENNEIGVAKLFLGLPDDAAFVVAELGARHPGDILKLAEAARPETAVLTNIGEAHLAVFGSREALARTKWAVFATGARRVLGSGDEESRRRAAADGLPALWFGTGDDPPAPAGAACAVLAGRATLRVWAAAATAPASFSTAVDVPGEHNLRNIAAAAAAALDLGCEPPAVAAALSVLELPPGRYERSSAGGLTVIYDAYNANASGTVATLGSFSREPASRRIAVLASMAELGDDAPEMHRAVGAAAAAAGLAVLLVGGEHAADLARGALEAGMRPADVVPFADNAAAAAWLRGHTRPGDLVLLKGSRRYRLEDVLAGLEGARA
jgi:UDP-N-acetylmuramoyl-tripeptide--D-alanyl-D-alanine ligase